MNRWDFGCRRNDDRVDAAVTVGGRLFQVEKDRSPSVNLRVAGTTNADELEDLRRCREGIFPRKKKLMKKIKVRSRH